ncbi:head maturation protease, ClpP-related [Dietzia cinnamea]|uniref:head maturation protease, ClpP-related n=1 Tax=Dietzia cinnamea TaxID=321318 RepID=UPI0021A46D45|nr:head maturation protease, ClpP-related [Dietzia cinnamea]MCT2121549.1 ATP-dependent Clp protease proteolytic subunit [Dietzia cinnamea]
MNPFITDPNRSRAEVTATVTDSGVATIRLYDPVDSWGGPFGVSAKEFVDTLDALPEETEEIRLLINCPGGEVWEGMAIYNSLRSHKARVVTVVEGLAASAASFIAMAGDEVIMRPASELMIHDAWIVGIGNADGLREIADRIDAETMLIAGIYAEKAGTAVDMWREAMRAETWFSPSEAVEAGLVDRVESGVPSPAASANRFNLASFNYAGRREAPAPAVQTSSALAEDNRKESSMADLMNELRQRLGVADADADEGTVLAALDEVLAEQAQEPVDDDPKDVSPDEDPEDEAPSNTVEPDEETVVLDKEVYADLLARAEKGDEFDEKTTREAAEEFVQNAIDAGKLSAASKDRWVTRVLGDPEDAKARINQMASGRVPREELGRGGSDNEASDNLSAAADRSGFATRPKL